MEAPLREVMERFEVFDEEGHPFPLEKLPGRRALGGEDGLKFSPGTLTPHGEALRITELSLCREAATIGSTPAVANAVIDALEPWGVTHLDVPMTAEKVWRAIQGGTLSAAADYSPARSETRKTTGRTTWSGLLFVKAGWSGRTLETYRLGKYLSAPSR